MAGRDTLTLIGADLGEGVCATVKLSGRHIRTVGEPPLPGESLLELAGARLLPGLINAHDHLQLNHLPRLEPARRYAHVRGWIADVDKERRLDGPLKSALAVPLTDRLFLGGVKNLLSGVTTVAHHDPLYPALCEPQYPLRVVRRYGWTHSLYIEGEARTRDSHRRTPADWPWIIHAAEGVNAQACEEFRSLERLGCLGPNTLIVHGVALGSTEQHRLIEASAGLIWCPSSNLHLFGATADVAELARQGRVALGTDSRLTGSQDLLTELTVASRQGALASDALEAMVTRDAARLLRLEGRGVIAPGARADLLVLPRGLPLERARRSDVRLLMVGGNPVYADPDVARSLGQRAQWADITVDGRRKALSSAIANRLRCIEAIEPGLDLSGRPEDVPLSPSIEAIPAKWECA